jgi:hypothetical protein
MPRRATCGTHVMAVSRVLRRRGRRELCAGQLRTALGVTVMEVVKKSAMLPTLSDSLSTHGIAMVRVRSVHDVVPRKRQHRCARVECAARPNTPPVRLAVGEMKLTFMVALPVAPLPGKAMPAWAVVAMTKPVLTLPTATKSIVTLGEIWKASTRLSRK